LLRGREVARLGAAKGDERDDYDGKTCFAVRDTS